MTIGEALRKARKAKGLTQSELAARLGVTQPFIGNYERGLRKPKLETLKRIASALDIAVYSLLDEEKQCAFSPPTEAVNVTVGERIKKARTNKGLTQKQLADKMQISYVNISQIENGQRTPKIDTVQRIATALGVAVEYLLDYSTETIAFMELLESKGLVSVLTNMMDDIDTYDEPTKSFLSGATVAIIEHLENMLGYGLLMGEGKGLYQDNKRNFEKEYSDLLDLFKVYGTAIRKEIAKSAGV